MDLALRTFEDLKQLPQWVVWIARKKPNGRIDKIPYNLKTEEHAKSNDPSTWATYQQAQSALQNEPQKYNGLGFMFFPQSGIMGIDLDHCIDEHGSIDQWARNIISGLNSYCEISPSGEGIHIFVRGTLPNHAGKRRVLTGERHPEAAIEMYDSGRFFTVTGKRLKGAPLTIGEEQQELEKLYAWLEQISQRRPAKKPSINHPIPISSPLSDNDLLEKAMSASNGQKFTALWRGDTSDYQGDESSADIALCTMLAFWTGKDAHRIDSLFRQSGLYREKWKRNARSGETYGEGTIKRAIEECREVYDPHNGRVAMLEKDLSQMLEHIKERQKQQGKKRRTPSPLAPRPVEIKKILECLGKNEYGDALLFKEAFDGQVCYDHTSKEWYLWSGQYWIPDRTGQVHLLVTGALGAMYLKAAADLYTQQAERETHILVLQADGIVKGSPEGNGELDTLQNEHKEANKLRAALNKRANDLRTARRNKNVQVFIKSEMGITSEMWDTHPWLLAVPNGVIDLHTGECRDSEPDDYIRTVCPTEWTGLDTPCPRFERFLQEIFEEKENHRESLIDFLHRYFGYGITGVVNVAMFLILYGEEGRNGKDTLLGILKEVLGPISGAISNDVFVSNDKKRRGGAATPHLCDLQGKRIVWGSETQQGDRLNIAQMKQITGGGEISARQLYGKQYQFTPTHKLLLMTNYKPHVDANDKAFWARVALVEFGLRFVAEPKAENERRADIHLKESLQQEASGILAWLVRGCLKWQKNGLLVPEIVQAATSKYRDEEDRILQFIRECCVTREEASIMGGELYTAYKEWCRANEIKPMNGKQFGECMKKRYKGKHKNKGTLYSGITVINESTPAEWLEQRDDAVTESVSPVTPSNTATGAILEGTPHDRVTVNTPNFTYNNSSPHAQEKLGVFTVTLSPSCDDKGTSEAASNKVTGESPSLTASSHGDGSTQRTFLEEATRLLAQVKNHIQTTKKTQLFWRGEGSGYENWPVSIEEYKRRVEECCKSRDSQRIEGALNAMKNTLEIKER